MENLLAAVLIGCRLSWGHMLAVPGACLAGDAQVYGLPMTGGDGPMIVTAIGIGLAVFSLILLFVMKRSGRKDKNKLNGQQDNTRRVPPPNASAGNGHFR